jgi:hypothetical protein
MLDAMPATEQGPGLAMDESASHLVTAATRHGQRRTLVDKDERRNISSASHGSRKQRSRRRSGTVSRGTVGTYPASIRVYPLPDRLIAG